MAGGIGQAVSKFALEAIRRGDLDALATVATSTNLELLKEMKPGTSRYESVFGETSWRRQAVLGWKGRVDVCLEHRGGRRQRCLFDGASVGELFIVQVDREGEAWRFDDVLSPEDAGWVRDDEERAAVQRARSASLLGVGFDEPGDDEPGDDVERVQYSLPVCDSNKMMQHVVLAWTSVDYGDAAFPQGKPLHCMAAGATDQTVIRTDWGGTGVCVKPGETYYGYAVPCGQMSKPP